MKKCILVTGMPHSGTSEITEILHIFRARLGRSQGETNKRDHFTSFNHSKIAKINSKILKELNASWDNPPEILDDKSILKKIRHHKDEIKNIIKEDFGKADLFAINDPQISILLPLYLEVLKELNINPCIVIMKRKDIEIAQSLRKRNNLHLLKSLELHEKYYDIIEKYTKKESRIYIEFDDLIKNPCSVIKKIKDKFKINLRSSNKTEGAILNFINKNLRHRTLTEKEFIKRFAKELLKKDELIKKLEREIEEREQTIETFKQMNLELRRELLTIKESLVYKFLNKFDNILLTLFPEKYIKKYFEMLLRFRNKRQFNNKIKHSSNIKLTIPKRARKKILFINHEETLTGAPKVLLDIAKEMKKFYEVKIVSLRKGSLHEDFIKNFSVIYPNNIKNQNKEALEILLKEKPDLVYANTVLTWPYALEAKRLRIPVIMHVHELKSGIEYVTRYFNFSFFNKLADIYIAVSKKVFYLLVKDMKCPPRKVKLIYPFISSEEIIKKSEEKSNEERLTKIKNEKEITIVIALGTACKRKGTDLFIEAHKILKKRGYENIKFIWIGKIIDDVDTINAILNKDKDFVFLGEKKNPYPYLKKADIFVLPSREDPFPLAALEAMLLEKPLIIFKDVTGISEIIQRCGIEVEKIESMNLAEAILNLSQNKEMMKEFSTNGKNIVTRRYDKNIIIPKIHRTIKSILTQK